MTARSDPPHVVVVGGGVTGLAAAWEATGRGARVTLLEASDRFGGLIRTSPIDIGGTPVPIDEGADAFLARVPDAVELCAELGLGPELTAPATGHAYVWVDGRLLSLPGSHVMGVPLDPDDPATVALVNESTRDRMRVDLGRSGPGPTTDVSIGDFITERLGREVVDRIVGPLVGGISAGDVDRLSMSAATPQLADAAARGDSFVAALRHATPTTGTERPVFAGLRSGTERLITALVDALDERSADLRTEEPVLAVTAGPTGVQVRSSTAVLDADGAVITTPARVAAGLVDGISPSAARELRSIHTTTVVLATLVFDTADVPGPLDGSGFLIPRDTGLWMTAVSWGSSKWSHWNDGRHVVLRVSAGHAGDRRAEDADDAVVLAALLEDLRTTMRLTAAPRSARVTRWTDAFPQYDVGHADRLARIDLALRQDAPFVQLAGMSYRGVGIPASIRSGRAAVRELLTPR
ncbi:MAG: protoporphyrinogen oxidase [Actinomycetota bacterium]